MSTRGVRLTSRACTAPAQFLRATALPFRGSLPPGHCPSNPFVPLPSRKLDSVHHSPPNPPRRPSSLTHAHGSNRVSASSSGCNASRPDSASPARNLGGACLVVPPNSWHRATPPAESTPRRSYHRSFANFAPSTTSSSANPTSVFRLYPQVPSDSMSSPLFPPIGEYLPPFRLPWRVPPTSTQRSVDTIRYSLDASTDKFPLGQVLYSRPSSPPTQQLLTLRASPFA